MDLSSDFSRVAAYKRQLFQKLMALRLPMAQVAQKVYNEWYQDEEGYDEMYGAGGICHDIAEAIVGVIYEHIPGVLAGTTQPSCGENHVYAMVCYEKQERDESTEEDDGFNEHEEGYIVDVPYHIYEHGGGYTWTKIKEVEFDANDVVISFVSADDVRANLEEGY